MIAHLHYIKSRNLFLHSDQGFAGLHAAGATSKSCVLVFEEQLLLKSIIPDFAQTAQGAVGI